MNVSSILKKLMSVLLAAILMVTMIPSAVYADIGQKNQSEHLSQIPEAVLPASRDDGEISKEDDWIATYPYGTFAFGDFQSDVAEEGAVNDEGKVIPSSIRIPVYRVGGTSGRVTAKITYAPAVTMMPDGSDYLYDYAASGKKDLVIRYEDPKTIAQYQEIGMPDGLRNMLPSDEAIVFEDPGDDVDPEDELVLILSGNVKADSYQWQTRSTLGWTDVKEAEDPGFPTLWKNVWDFDKGSLKDIDYRCIYVIDGQYYCSESLFGEKYEKIPPIPKAPEDLPLDEKATYSVLEFEDDFDVYEFDLTFADGETVKYIEIDAIDDNEPELPEMGIFTIVECEGGELSDLCNTHTVLVSDNDEHGISEIGFEVKDYRVDRNSGTAYVKVIRKGDKSYNVTVDYTTEDGTAKEGVDYAKASGTIALLGSIDEIEIPIDLIKNNDTESKTFKVKLSNVKGGGLDGLCSIASAETTVTLVGVMSSEERAGLNLASVLAGSDGENLTSSVEVSENALIKDRTVTEWNYEGKNTIKELEGVITIHPATRSHLAYAGLTFSRKDYEDWVPKIDDQGNPVIENGQPVYVLSGSSYEDSGDYWVDRELMTGVDHRGLPSGYSEGLNVMNYPSEMAPIVMEEDYVNGEIPSGVKTSAGYKTGTLEHAYMVYTGNFDVSDTGYEDRSLQYYRIASNYEATASLTIEHAGLLFKDFHFSFDIENYGKKGSSSYIYPMVWFEMNGEESRRTSRNITYGALGESSMINVRSDKDFTRFWILNLERKNADDSPVSFNNTQASSTSDEQVVFETLSAYTQGRSRLWYLDFEDNPLSTGIDFISVDQYDQDYTPRTSPEVADSQTIVDIINFNFGRRAFADNMTIPVVIYTANDDNELQNGWSPIDVSTKEGKDIYDRLAPEISIVAKNGGVTKGGGLYVGSTLKVNCSRVAGFIVNPNLGVYLTNADGKIVAQGKAANGEGTIYEITFLWSDMTEADLSGKYQLNVVYDRSQTILIDIAPSVPRLSGSTSIDTNSVPSVWGGLFSGNKTIKVEYGKAEVAKTAQTVTVDSDNNASTFTDYTNFESLTLDLGSGDFKGDTGKGIYASNTNIKNVQSICFNQSEDDVIVFNGQAYKGNEYIPLDSNDIVAQNLIFRYYAADYLDAISTMVATFDHAELYYDGDGDGEISGSFVGSVFVPSGDDVFVGNIKGEHFEQEFAPKLKGDDGVYQYYIKAIYSLRPRALKLPAGASADSYAQVYPVFLSAVTDDKESDKLTREQKAYRYIRGNNTDGHTMYGAEASKLAYIDIPLGGDTSKVKRYSVTTGVYDTSGEKLIDSINTTEYTWEPEYTGALVVGFDNPEPVINDDNITGRAIPYAGEAPELTEDGQYLYSDDGLDKLNAYLGAFAGRTTFGLCVQEQVKAFSEINSIADLTPESIEKGNVSSVPNGNNVVNFGSGENKDETEGETPDGTGFNEFGSDNGMKLPSLEFGIGDYATLVMDGDEIGISIGIPLFKAESTSYGTDNTTTGADGSTTETYKDDDGNTVKKTTKPDGSTETETTTVDDDKPNNRKTVTRRVETVDKDGNKTYFNETKTYETAPGKDDRHMATITDTDAPSTPSNNDADEKTNGFKEANGQMKTLKDFACAVVSRAKGNPGAVSSFMDGAFEDDTLKKAKNGQSSCRKVSVSLSVQIALNFEYNPIYNTHKFSSGAISASVSFEFSLQYRFTPVPLVYVYVKTGVSVEIGIGMGMVYSLVEKDPITKFESGNMESLEKKNGKMIFKLDKEYSGFHSYFYGKMYMEVFDHMPKAGDKALTSGVISSRGDVSEVLLSQYKGDLYICLTSIGDKVTMTKLMPITKASKAYFNGASITPSVSVEAGVGVGIELLKFELYVKTNLAITATFGQYIPDEDKYEPAYMSNFDWNISVGFNVVLLFINYSMDCVAFSVNGEQDGTGGYFTWVITASAANGMKELWTETRYTDAHGKPISDPTGGRRSESSERTVRSVEGGRGLIRISSPTDITQTQKINEVKTSVDELQRIMRGEVEETRSFPATGTKDFELSGYGTSGDARILATGLTTGYSYKLFTSGEENYIIYSMMIDHVPQLVMSKVIMVGNLSTGTGLQNPVSATAQEPYIVLDGDGLADYDYSVSVDGSTVTAVWTAEGEKGLVVKRASVTLGTDDSFSTAQLLCADDGTYRYLPDHTDDISVYSEAYGTSEETQAAKAMYKAYLTAKNPLLVGEDYDLLEDGDTNDPMLLSAVYSYVTVTKLIDMQGTSTALSVVPGSEGNEAKTVYIPGEVIENIETVRIGNKTLVAYTTSSTAYFDTETFKTETIESMDPRSERGIIRRLYIREITDDGFGTAKMLQEVVDFEGCTADNLSSAALKDGVYVNHSLSGAGEADPHYANLRFITAALEAGEDPETFMLFEMGSNTYILRQDDILSVLGGSNAQVTLTPVFQSTQGTDVTIGSDGKNLAVVYTSAMPNTMNNAIWIAWWDVYTGGWGESTVLAMRHLQIYEDSISYGMTPEETESAYLGKTKTPGENKGSMTRLSFTDLQMSTREVEEGGKTYQQLMVLTEGSMIDLQDFEFTNAGGDKVETVIPARRQSEVDEDLTEEIPPSVGFYAIAFGQGEQAIGEATLSFANYDFTAGNDLVGELNFRNVGTAAIRASSSNPATILLSVTRPGEGSELLAKWLLGESVPSGGSVRLTFETDVLTNDLPTGSKFSLYLTEDAKLIEEMYHGEAFSTTVFDLFEVSEKAELSFGDFDVDIRSIKDGYATVYIETSVQNIGNKDAGEVYIQFSYDTGKEDEYGKVYEPINLDGNTLTTGFEETIKRKAVEANNDTGVYMLADEKGGHVIRKGYKRSVSGTIQVPVSAFLSTEDLSGLHLKAEIYSSDDNPTVINKVYASQHEEYNQSNNSVIKTIKHITEFNTPSQVSLSLGNTLRLPVPYYTTADHADIVVTEIDSGAEGWQSLLGILYFDSSTNTIVAAANETAEAMIEEGLLPTGIIQVKDTATNSITAITFRITEGGDGVNICREDKSFTFYNKDNSETDTDAATTANSGEGWYFVYNVPSDAWTGGEKEGEVPMNSDLSRAIQNGAYVKFLTTADTMKIYFTGKIKVESSAFGTAQEFTKSPAELDFNNKSGLTHEITITATKNSELDRYTADYAVSPVVMRDDDAPQIFWSRSFPETASMKPGTEMTIRCYIVDNGGVSKVSIGGKEITNKTETRLWKVSDGFYYFDYTFTKNGDMEVVACDTVTNTVRMSFKVDWYNAIVSSSATYDAPGLVPGMVRFVDDNGDPASADVLTEAPWLFSEYTPADNEESRVYLYMDGDFEEVKLEKAEGAEKWKIISNGYYMVKVDREDGTWARVIIMMNRLDIDEPQLSIEVEGNVINFTVSDDKNIATVTINGMPVEISGNPFTATYEPSLGGSYTIEVTDDAGNVTTRTVDIEVQLEVPEDAVDMSIIYDGRLIGTVKVDTEKLIGGQYDETVSDPAQGEYHAVYYAAVVPKDTDPADIKDEDFKAAEEGIITIGDIYDGEYDIYVKDSKGHIVKYDDSFHVYHPGDQWKDPVYEWAWDYSSVTASRQSKLYSNYVQSETQWTFSWMSKAPTCEEKGETTYMASFDSSWFATQYATVANIAALGHEWGEWTVVKKPGDYETGEEERVCSRDKTHVERRDIPALGAPTYSFEKGVKSQWQKGDGSLAFVVGINRDDERALGRFKTLMIDGKEVDPSGYSVDLKNSTVYVKEEFLRKLRKGDHDIKIVLEDGSIATSFTVIKNVPWLLYAGIALLLLLLLLLLWFFMKRRKNR